MDPPREWLAGPEGELRRNYGQIGILSFAIFLLAQEDETISDDAVQELKALFRAEAIPDDCLNDYLAELKTGDAVGAFREFVVTFSKAVPDDPRSNERIFDNVGSPPSSFDSNVSRTLQLTIAEACSCYKHECYLATIALCGKVIETLLADAFHVLMGKPKPEKMGFAEVRKALRDKGMPLDESMDQLLILIYTHRSVVIHDAGQLQDYEFPKKGLAESVAGLTQEAINIMYDYFNK